MSDQIVLLERWEVDDQLGMQLTDEQWLRVKIKIAGEKGLWQILDDTVSEIVEELCGE